MLTDTTEKKINGLKYISVFRWNYFRGRNRFLKIIKAFFFKTTDMFGKIIKVIKGVCYRRKPFYHKQNYVAKE